MANNIIYVPQIDYTSRDYQSIRNDLLDLIPVYAPNWTSRDPSDLGIALIELFSYMGDSLNFYIDRAANEGFIGTASQRDSILQLASMLGYIPNKITAATTTLTVSNTGSSDQTIPAGTIFGTSGVTSAASDQVFFESLSDVTVSAGTTSTVTIAEGFTISDEDLGSSNGSPKQVFKLSYPSVISGSISITVGGKAYAYASSFLDYGMTDYVFTVFNDSEGSTFVAFGDGINGVVPTAAAQILATYRSGTGAAGNVPAGVITNQLTNVVSGITVTNYAAATGGSDEETTDSIRFNAPKALRSLSRAVSLKDYASLALQVPGVAKAVADASSLNSVNLYVAPSGDPGISGTTATSAFNALATTLYSFFMDKAAPNSSLNILPPTYAPLDIAMTVYVLPQYQQNAVTSNLMTALRSIVALDNSFFADVIPVQYLMKAASTVQGIDYVTVDVLKRTGKINLSYWLQNGSTVTAVTSAAHSLTSGQKAYIDTTTASTVVEGSWTLSGNTTNTVTFTTTASSAQATSARTGTTIGTQTPTYSSPNVTMTTGSAHGLSVGQQVIVSGVTPTGYNGVWTTATGTTGSTLVLNIGSNPGAITVAGSVLATAPVIATQTPTYSSPNLTITTSSVHGLSAGDSVTISGVVPSAYNGTWSVAAAPSTTTFSINTGSNYGAITTAGTAAPYIGTIDLWQGVSTITCAVNEIPSEGTFVISPIGGIS
jgi:hypothetical protein